MLNLESDLIGRHYVEAVRQPAIVRQLGAALRGEQRRAHRGAARGATEAAADLPRAGDAGEPRGGGAVLVLHDISDLRRIDRVRRDFVANVSHELRTPLTAVRGYVEALLEELDRIGPAQEVSRGHRSPHRAHGAAGSRPAASRAARRAPGNGRAPPHRARLALSTRSRPISRSASIGQRLQVDVRVDSAAGDDRGGHDEDARRAAQPDGKRGELRADGGRIELARASTASACC